MNVVKFNPFRPVNEMSLFDEFFNRSISDVVGSDFATNVPNVNVREDDRGFHLDLAAPGLDKNDFRIEIEKNALVVSAEIERTEETEDRNYKRREFNYSSFKRSFYLPKTVDAEKVSASYENGVLSLLLPKKEEVVKAEQVKTIEIK